MCGEDLHAGNRGGRGNENVPKNNGEGKQCSKFQRQERKYLKGDQQPLGGHVGKKRSGDNMEVDDVVSDGKNKANTGEQTPQSIEAELSEQPCKD